MQKLLNFEVISEPNFKKIVVIAHGLFGSLKNWKSVAKQLAASGYKVVVVDMRNHGSSFWDDEHCYKELAHDLKNVINAFGGLADVIGHSMGGKAVMSLALLYPECVRKLVVVDIAPVKYEHSQLHLIEALESVNLNQAETRKELIDLLSLSINDYALRAFFVQSADLSNSTGKRWFFNLKSLKKNLSIIMDFPNLQLQNSVPALVIRGARSNYVSDKHLSILTNYFPNFKLSTIHNAGHWVHAEKFSEFLIEINDFLTPKT